MLPPLEEDGYPAGAYDIVAVGIYCHRYYSSRAASSVVSFPTNSPIKFETFIKKSSKIPSPKFVFGSLAFDHSLVSSDISELSSDAKSKIMEKIMETAVDIPLKDIPEVWTNLSLYMQLDKHLKKHFSGDYKLSTQTTKFICNSERKQLPYNEFFNSIPDLVCLRVKQKLITVSEDPGPSDDDGNFVEEDDIVDFVAELKRKGEVVAQLWAESFNVLVSDIVVGFQSGKKMDTPTFVYCISLSDNCQKGKISKLGIDLSEAKCSIEQDSKEYSTDECFDIVLNQ